MLPLFFHLNGLKVTVSSAPFVKSRCIAELLQLKCTVISMCNNRFLKISHKISQPTILYYICKKLKEVLFVRNKQKVKNVKEKIVKNDWINMKI